MKDVVIKDFYLGIGESEFVGNGEIRNCDTSWKKGVLRIGYESVSTSAGTVTTLPIWILADPDASVRQQWAIDDGIRVYRGTASANQWSVEYTQPGRVPGLAVWKDHVITTTSTSVIGYGPISIPGAATTYVIGNMDSDTAFHPMIVGQDDILYGGAGRYVFSLQEVSGQDFRAGTAATFTFTSRALDLPEQYRVRCIEELGEKLMIGTWVGNNIQDQKVADIFPWDRTSDSFGLPIRMRDNGIQSMLNVDGLLYFFSGLRGNLNATDGSTVKELIKEIPQQIINNDGGLGIFEMLPSQMIQHGGKIIFASNSNTFDTNYAFSYEISSDSLAIENTVSGGTGGSMALGGLLSVTTRDYLIGWDNGSSAAIDKVTGGRRYSSYSAFATSPYIKMGTKSNPEPLSEIEISLEKPLTTGEGIRLSYRTDTSASFTTIPDGTVDFATYGAVQEQHIPFRLEVTNGIQIRVEVTTGSAASNTPGLTQVILR